MPVEYEINSLRLQISNKRTYSVDVRLNGGSGIFIPTALCVKTIACQFGIPFAGAMSILQLLGNAKTQDTDTVDLTSSSAATSLKVAAQVPDTNCYLKSIMKSIETLSPRLMNIVVDTNGNSYSYSTHQPIY